MRIKIFLKCLISISVAIILFATLIGCFDLGDFSDEEAYYSAFGDVRLVYQNPTDIKKNIESEDYSVRDYFYNKNTGEDFTYGDPKDEEADEGKDIPQLPYVYMAIPLEEDLRIESVALYFNATKTCSLEVFFYVVDDLPNGGDFTNIRLLGEPEYQQKLDGGGNPVIGEDGEPVYEYIEYSDPDDNLIVSKSTVQLIEGKWDSIVVDNWKEQSSIEVKSGQYLLLRFVNNSGLNNGDNLSVAFRTTNLLIRAFY